MIGKELEEARAWCLYLAAIHRAVASSGRTVFMPVSYQCTRRPGALTGCGCCYQCTKALIGRALYTSTCPDGEMEEAASGHAESVFRYVVGLDPRLSARDGLNDDYCVLEPERFAKVMQWAAEIVTLPARAGSGAQQLAAAEQATGPAYRPTANRQQFYTCPRCQADNGAVDPDCGSCDGYGYVIWDPRPAPPLEPVTEDPSMILPDPVEVESMMRPYDEITAGRTW